MKIIYLIILALVLYLVAALVRFKYISSHARLDSVVQADRSVGQGPSIKYVAAGDSTAVGTGASSLEKTYPYQIAEYLGSSHTVEYKNVARGGSTTRDLINDQLDSIVAFNPDIVTISIGGNDLTHWRNKSNILEDYKTIIEALTSKTTATIYITDIPNFSFAYLLPPLYRKFLESKIKSLNPELLQLATDRVEFIDIHNFGWENYPDLSVTVARDQFHPNDEGYQNWTNAFLSKIKNNY